jgi:hypothetical protein
MNLVDQITGAGIFFASIQRHTFLDYVRAATFASDDYPGKLAHYGIVCLSHVVDVVSIEEPAISVLRRA